MWAEEAERVARRVERQAQREAEEAERKAMRAEDEENREYSSKVSRYYNPTAPRNHTPTVPYSRGPKPLRALCLASETAEMWPSSVKNAKAWRFENEAHRPYQCV